MASYQEESETATQRSGIYGLFAALLNRPIDEERVHWLQMLGKVIEDENTLFADERENEHILKGLRLWRSFVQEVKTLPHQEIQEMLGVERTRLFRGIKPGYGPPPPYETVYALEGRKEENTHVYAQEGLKVSKQVKEEPDYLGIQLEFMQQLTASEALAWEEGNIQEVRRLLTAETDFLSIHLNSWVGRYVDRAFPEANTYFYQGFLSLLQGYLTVEERSLNALTI